MVFTSVDLSTVTPYYDTEYSGGAIVPLGDYADFGLTGLVRDPTASYEFVLDVTVDPSPATTRAINVYSSNGDPDTSMWWALGISYINGTQDEANQTVSVTIGPGIQQFDSAGDELGITIETYQVLAITGVRYQKAAEVVETPTIDVPLVFVEDISVNQVSPVDGTISNPPRGGVRGSGSLADLDDVNYLYLWGTHTGDNLPPGLDAFSYSLPAAPDGATVVSAVLTFQAKLLPFSDGIVILRDTGEEMTYTDWPGTPDARLATLAGQATAQDMHFVFDDAANFDLSAEVNTFDYAPYTITINPTMLDWSIPHTLTIFAWDGSSANSKPTAQLRLTQAYVTFTYIPGASIRRLFVNIGTDEDRDWQKFTGDTAGVGYVNIGTDEDRNWVKVDDHPEMKLQIGDADDNRQWIEANS